MAYFKIEQAGCASDGNLIGKQNPSNYFFPLFVKRSQIVLTELNNPESE